MARFLRFIVLTPERTLLAVDSVRRVRVRLADGTWLSLYPRHAPLIAETFPGPVYYLTVMGDPVREGSVHEGMLDVAAGVVFVADDEVTLFTEGLVSVEEMAATWDDEGAARFDRLARALMGALRAQPGGVLGEV